MCTMSKLLRQVFNLKMSPGSYGTQFIMPLTQSLCWATSRWRCNGRPLGPSGGGCGQGAREGQELPRRPHRSFQNVPALTLSKAVSLSKFLSTSSLVKSKYVISHSSLSKREERSPVHATARPSPQF